MENTDGVTERIWVRDRGRVSEANSGFLRERQARHLGGTPKIWRRYHEAKRWGQSNWQEAQAGGEVRFFAHEGGPPAKDMSWAAARRAEKYHAMLPRQSEGLTATRGKIAAWLSRPPQTDQEALGRRIGRALGQFPAAAAIIQAAVQRATTGRAVDLQIVSAVDA